MDLFRTPGASLEGADRKSFDEIKELIDSATNDFLVRADWNANMACVDRMNSIRSPPLMNEVAFLLRKKISSKSAQTVGLTMQLIGSFVSNCGQRFYAVLNDERFTRTIADAVRYFSKRPGHDSKDTTDVSLDLIQWWGEAFLPRRRDYYFIVDLYFNLRKEGLPFKPQQFDPNRVPLFSSDVGAGNHRDNTDAILAASLASEMALQDEQDRRQHHRPHNQDHRQPSHGREEYYEDSRAGSYGAGGGGGGSYSDTSATSTAEVVQSLRSCMMILKDLILAATNFKDFRQDEIAQDVVVQLQVYQSKMPGLIEQGLMTDPEGVEALFSLNEDSQSLMAIFDKIKNGHVNLVEGQRQAGAVRCGAETSDTFQSVSAVPPHGHGNQKPNSRPPSRASPVTTGKTGGADLLDMDFGHFPAPQARHSPAQGTAYSHQQHHQPPHYPAQGGANYGHGHAPSPGRHSPHVADPFAVPHAPHQAHHPPQQYQQQQPHHAQEAPRHTHSPHMVHPPAHPPVHSHHVEKPVAIIELPSNDPFTTDSLDALFTGTPVVHAKDPFSPDALDALFDAEPAPAPVVVPAAKKPQPDPFSDAALDALFAAPAPKTPAHGHGHTTHQAYTTQQAYSSQQTHHAQVQYGASHAAPNAQYAPQAYHQSPVHGYGQPQAYPGGAQYPPAQQYAPRAAYPPQQQQQQQQPPHGQAYHVQAQAYHQQQHPPQQPHHARQDQASANPFDLMDS
eukprot:gene13241-15258_t